MITSPPFARLHTIAGFALSIACNACSSSTSQPSPSPDAGAPSSSTSEGTSSDAADSTSTARDGGATSTTDATSPLDAGDSSEPTTGVQDSGATEETSVDDTGDGGVGVPDGGPGDGGGAPSDPWFGCPTEGAQNDETGPIVVDATPSAVYCATFNENRTLKEEQLAKAQLRLAPGSYRLPDAPTSSIELPWCLRDSSGVSSFGPGELSVNETSFEGTTSYSLVVEQGALETTQTRLRVALDRSFSEGEDILFELDGTETSGFDSYQSLELCEVDGDYCLPNVIFTSCAYESGELNTHTVEFEGGEVVFELRLGDSFAGTEPGAFVAARGSLDGVEFEQRDYFKLIYHPTHHHFERAFVVLFDAPRGNVCGLEVSALEPFGDDVPDQAFTVDCELNRLEELEVNSHSLLRGSP